MWVRRAGRVWVVGDSIAEGWYDLVGGFRPGLGSALAAAGLSYEYVGTLSDAYGAHDGVAGATASSQTSALQTTAGTLRPRVAVVNIGVNDIGGGSTPAACMSSVASIVGWIRAGAPQASVFLTTMVVPTGGVYYARRDEIAAGNALLPATAAAAGAHVIDIAAPPTSDGLHPTAAGYAAMATAIASALVARLP